tara:strand:+ start:86 stop:865 length:780 start_codon:yes stop_codon:yes gene_type:complete
MNLNLRNKKALVSGGTNGIGLAIAIGLAKEGCDVAVFSRTQERVDKTKKLLDDLGCDNICIVADVLDKNSYDYVEKEIKEKWGGVDILVNNIGGGGRWGKPDMLDNTDLVWEEVFDKNLTSCRKYTQMFLPYMLEKKWGRVITITSIYGIESGGRPWFNTSKFTQSVLMKNLAKNKNYAEKNVTFNSVAPGAIYIKETGWEKMKIENPKEFKEFESSLPRGRMGTPEEVASLVSFLCSERASLINGASISVDGGESHVV